MPLWLVVLTSAAVGSVVSGVIALLTQFLERRSRRRELFLQKAIDLAQVKNERILRARLSGQVKGPVLIQDEIFFVREFFTELEHLFRHGELTPSGEKHYVADVKSVREYKDEE